MSVPHFVTNLATQAQDWVDSTSSSQGCSSSALLPTICMVCMCVRQHHHGSRTDQSQILTRVASKKGDLNENAYAYTCTVMRSCMLHLMTAYSEGFCHQLDI